MNEAIDASDLNRSANRSPTLSLLARTQGGRPFVAIERGLIHVLRFTHARAELQRASVACPRTVRTGQGA